MKIEPKNQMAQILHRATGNPSITLPHSAISNCFPGLDFDFKQFWRRALKGIVLLESDNYVVAAEDPQFTGLVNHRLFRIENKDIIARVFGPVIPGGDDDSLAGSASTNIVTMEWSNVFALIQHRQGQKVKCQFSSDVQKNPLPIPTDSSQIIEVEIEFRQMLENSISPSPQVLQPGELTQGLCSPWQHDYRECACYYWPATRPDYVNVEPGPDGLSRGDNWMSKKRSGEYVLDDRIDGRMISYNDLFTAWEKMLKFQIKGRDAEEG